VKTCTQCNSQLLGPVSFCPFCGQTTGTTAATAIPPKVEVAGTTVSDMAAGPMPTLAPTLRHAQTPKPISPPKSTASTPQGAARQPEKPKEPARPTGPTTTPRVVTVEKEPVKVPPKADTPKARGKFLRNAAIAVAILIVLLGFLSRGPNKQDVLCDQQVAAGTKLAQGGDVADAAEQSRLAATSCTGSRTVKASELQTLVTTTRTAQIARAQCTRSYDMVSSRLNDGRLNAAVNALNQLPSSCATSSDATHLRDQIEQVSASADATEQKVRAAIGAGDSIAALAALQDLARLDRFRPTLPALRTQIGAIRAVKPADQAAGPNGSTAANFNSPAPANSTQPPVIARPSPQIVQPTAPAYNNQAALAQQFLNDAQTALGQSRFDAAKTYLDSARRMDPNNQRIDVLTRAVREREHEVLQDETSIK
jgi:hypothetical protein